MIIQTFNSYSKTRSGTGSFWRNSHEQRRANCLSLHKVKTEYQDKQYVSSSTSFNNTEKNFANLEQNSFIRRAYHKINSRTHFKSFNEGKAKQQSVYQPQNRECSRHKLLLMRSRQRINTQSNCSDVNKTKRNMPVHSHNNGSIVRQKGQQSQKLQFQLKKMMLGQKRINKSFILNFKDRKKEERLNKVKEHIKSVRIRMPIKKISTRSGNQGQADDFRPWSNLSEHEDINHINEYH